MSCKCGLLQHFNSTASHFAVCCLLLLLSHLFPQTSTLCQKQLAQRCSPTPWRTAFQQASWILLRTFLLCSVHGRA